MKLQINDSGSWRHVVTFDSTVENATRERSVKLLAIINERARMRILDDRSKVKATCKGPEFTWCDVPR